MDNATTGGVYKFHPYAMILPPVSEEDYGALKQSIQEIGQTTPALVDEAGAVVDGKHRAQACEDLGIPLLTETLPADADLWTVAVSSNVIRRSLTKAQVALIAARTVTSLPNVRGDYSNLVTRAKAAKAFGVSDSYVAIAKRLLNGAEDAPDLMEAVEDGSKSLRSALEEMGDRGIIVNNPAPPPKRPPTGRSRSYLHAKRLVKSLTTLIEEMKDLDGDYLDAAVADAVLAQETLTRLRETLKERN